MPSPGVHVLPFFPYSSDDGFAIIDYLQVNPTLGDWEDIKRIASRFNLMVDLVVNHVSSQHEWFQQFKTNQKPGAIISSLPTPRRICRRWCGPAVHPC